MTLGKRLRNIIICLFLLLGTGFSFLYAEEIDPAYLSETKECQFTPELKELAKQLEYNPVKIYNWVYENIEYEPWYFGSLKGAYGTYLTKRGNDWDHASLLIALLRISRIPARYVYQDSNNYYVYVDAYISMNDYRGNDDSSEKAWIPLTTWAKNYRIEPGIDLFPNGAIPTELNFNFSEYLSSSKQKNALELFEEDMQKYLTINYPGKTLKDIPYKTYVIKKPSSIIPSALPLGWPQFNAISAEVPLNIQRLLNLGLFKQSNNEIFLETGGIFSQNRILFCEVVGKRLSIDFIPASDSDAQIISGYGGVSKTPAGAAKLTPILKLDGKIIKQGGTISTGENFTCKPMLIFGEWINRYWKAGTYVQIGCDPLIASEITIQKNKEELKKLSTSIILDNSNREEYLGRIGQILVTTFMLRDYETLKKESELLHCEPWFNEGAFIFVYILPEQLENITKDSAAKFLIHPQWNIDASSGFVPVRKLEAGVLPYIQDTTHPFYQLFNNLYMHNGSYNEGCIFEDWQDTPGANTVKGIMIANEQGIPVVTLTKADIIDGHLPILENETTDRLEDSFIQTVINELNSGKTVTMPIRKIKYEGMVFSVYKYIVAGGWGMMFNYDRGGAASPTVVQDTSLENNTSNFSATQNYTNENGQINTQDSTVNRELSTAGDPVDMVTGESYHEENPDFDIKSRGFKLDIIRKYRSQLIFNGPFGYGWAWNHAERLLIGTNGELVFYNADCNPYYLTSNGDGTYQYPAGTTFIMEKQGSQYILTQKDKNKILFSETGLLTEKEYPDGNALIFEYNNNVQLIKIVDPLGRYLSFNYNAAGKIIRISDFLGRSCFYDYDADDLVRFTDLEGNTFSYEYLKAGQNGPVYDYTKLLLYCDNTYDSTKFVDNLGHNVVAIGNARQDTTQSKFGGASALFDGTGDYLSLADSDDWDFGSGDFTIDFQVRFNTSVNEGVIFEQWGTATTKSFVVDLTPTAIYLFYSTDGSTRPNRSVTWSPSADTWYHIAIVRNGNDLKFFVNGNQQGNTQDFTDVTLYNSSDVLHIGQNIAILDLGAIYPLNGWLDEIRVSKGIARWTANFTPPTQQYNFSQDISGQNYYEENSANAHNMSKYTLPNGDYLEIGYYKNDTVSFHRNKKNEVFSFQYSRLNRYAETWDEEGYYRKVFYNENNDVIRVTTQEKTVELKDYDSQHNLISYTDANGNTTVFTYDANRNVTSKADALGNIWYYAYDLTFNKPIRITDPNGNITLLDYDNRGNLLKITDALGNSTTYAYDAYGNMIKLTDAKSNYQENIYDADGLNLIEITDKKSNRMRYAYDGIGNVISETDPENNTTDYDYNNYNQKTKITDALNNITRYEYDANRFLTKTIEANGAVTQNVYDTVRDIVSGAKIMQIIDPLEHKESFEYDKLGNMISKTDKNGNTTLFKYDEMSRLIETTDPFQNTLHNTYDGRGRLTSITDKRGNTIAFTYDAAGRKTSVIDPYGNKTLYTYDKNGNLLKETNALGIITKYEYDKLNHITKKILGEGLINSRIFQFEYDALGKLAKTIDPLGNYTVFEYDPNGNKIKETVFDVLGNKLAETSYAYDSRNLLIKKTDPNGNLWQIEYDALQRKIAEIDPLENRSEYAYDKVGNIRTIKDQIEYVTAFTYNLRKEKIKETNAYGNAKQFYYDANGNLTSVTDEMDNTIQYGYDSLNRKIGETDALGATTTFDYDESSNLVQKTFPWVTFPTGGMYSEKYVYEYDKNNRIIKQINPWAMGTPVIFEYDILGRLVKTKDPRNAETINQYNEFNEVVTVTNALGDKVTREYDALGRLIKITDGRGIATVTEYDAFGRVTKIIQAAGTVDEVSTTFAYDANGNKIKETNALGVVTNFTYDKRNLLIKKTLVGELGLADIIFQYEYDAKSQLIKTIDPKGNTTTFTYDKLGRKIKETNPEGNFTKFEYDKVGNLLCETTPEGKKIIYGYDANRRRVKIIIDGKEKLFSYDEIGHLNKEIDFNGGVTVYEYRGYADRLTKKIEGWQTQNMATTYFSYDMNLNLNGISSFEPGSRIGPSNIRFDYDLLNRRIAEYDYDNSVKRFKYDASGNLIQITRRDGLLIYKTFDNLNRLTEVRTAINLLQLFSYDKLSRMTKAVDYNFGRKTHTVDFEYDCFNRVTVEIEDGKRIRKDYDLNSNVSKLTYPSGKVVEKTYTSLNKIKEAWYQNTKVAAFTYDKDARLSSLTYANAINLNLTYNNQGLEQERKYAQGAQILYGMSTSYDPEGNILTETILRNNEQIIKSYAYDSLNRLTQENSSLRNNFWQYENDFNNIISTNQNGYNETREVDYSNYKYTQYKQINSNPLTYDANGNLTSYNDKQYLFDWANRLIEVRENGSTVSTYTYDALNRRVTKYTASDVKTITFIYDAHQLIEEYSSIFASPDRIYAYAVYLDDPLLMETNNQRYYYLKDRQYNIVGLANENGSLQEAYSYSAFGLMSIYDATGALQIKSPLGNPFGYTGRYFDSETSLWYYRNRMYDPKLNRFLSRDPKGYIDGINLYAYVKNNPLRYLDPLGLSAREKDLLWYDQLALLANQQAEVAKDFYIEKLATNSLGVGVATTIATAIDLTAGVFNTPSAIGHLGEGTGKFIAKPSLETAPGMLMDVSVAASVLATVGSQLNKPYNRYIGPESNKTYDINGNVADKTWLTRDTYATMAEAKDKLQLPNMPTNVEKVKVPWYRYVGGPDKIAFEDNPQLGSGGGIQYRVGGLND